MWRSSRSRGSVGIEMVVSNIGYGKKRRMRWNGTIMVGSNRGCVRTWSKGSGCVMVMGSDGR